MSGKQRLYRSKIKTITSLSKTFNAMELIASSKISSAKKSAEQFFPYDNQIINAISTVAAYSKKHLENKVFKNFDSIKKSAILVLSSDKGLAGSFNSNIFRETDKLMHKLKVDEKNDIDLYIIGSKGHKHFRNSNVKKIWEKISDKPSFDVAIELSQIFFDAYGKEYSSIYIVYNHFKNMLVQVPTVVKLLPIIPEKPDGNSDNKVHSLYEFEPSADIVFKKLIPLYIQCRVYDFCLQSCASEMASRQSAMHTAADNASDLINHYTILANKSRQEEITNEITEIVAGANS